MTTRSGEMYKFVEHKTPSGLRLTWSHTTDLESDIDVHHTPPFVFQTMCS